MGDIGVESQFGRQCAFELFVEFFLLLTLLFQQMVLAHKYLLMAFTLPESPENQEENQE